MIFPESSLGKFLSVFLVVGLTLFAVPVFAQPAVPTSEVQPSFALTQHTLIEYSGDGDGFLEAGEEAALFLELENLGQVAEKVRVQIQGDHPFNVLQAETVLGALDGDDVVRARKPIRFKIPEDAPLKPVLLQLLIQAGDEAHSVEIPVYLQARRFSLYGKLAAPDSFDVSNEMMAAILHSPTGPGVLLHDFKSDEQTFYHTQAPVAQGPVVAGKYTIWVVKPKIGPQQVSAVRWQRDWVRFPIKGREILAIQAEATVMGAKEELHIATIEEDYDGDRVLRVYDLRGRVLMHLGESALIRLGLDRIESALAMSKGRLAWAGSKEVQGVREYHVAYTLIKSPKKTKLTTSLIGRVEQVAFTRDKIVFSSREGGQSDLFQYDYATNNAQRVFYHPADQSSPVMVGAHLAWVDTRNGQKDIFVQQDSGKTVPLLEGPSEGTHFRMVGNKIFWVETTPNSLSLMGAIVKLNAPQATEVAKMMPQSVAKASPSRHSLRSQFQVSWSGHLKNQMDEAENGLLERIRVAGNLN